MSDETSVIANLLHDMRQHVTASGEGDDIEEKWYEHIVAALEQIEGRCEQRANERIDAVNKLLTQTAQALKLLTAAIEEATQ